jgi:hypothetical protein
MTAEVSKVLDRLTTLWNVPSPARPPNAPPVRLYRDRTVSAAAVYTTLLQEFREPEIRTAVSSFLMSIVAKYEQDAIPDKDEQFLTGCCLELIAEPDGLRVDKALVQGIVCVFPTSIWYNSIEKLVGRYLSRSDLLAAIIERTTRPSHPEIVLNCLAAFGLYVGATLPDQHAHPAADLLAAFRKRLNEINRGADAETARLTKLAAAKLEQVQETRPPH